MRCRHSWQFIGSQSGYGLTVDRRRCRKCGAVGEFIGGRMDSFTAGRVQGPRKKKSRKRTKAKKPLCLVEQNLRRFGLTQER